MGNLKKKKNAAVKRKALLSPSPPSLSLPESSVAVSFRLSGDYQAEESVRKIGEARLRSSVVSNSSTAPAAAAAREAGWLSKPTEGHIGWRGEDSTREARRDAGAEPAGGKEEKSACLPNQLREE
ncbi:hypothetical protein CesoFtcFv8_005932 [Champsocephalus esox]|uniref:Uncharacterized protein n=1 Tax=Champsocephalus esox TaxID=159716 RepID=A0AAN8H6Y4_9TELE|nr:hypothetical protein CesoFtcFv8_005932 [Champsocephalus esox]